MSIVYWMTGLFMARLILAELMFMRTNARRRNGILRLALGMGVCMLGACVLLPMIPTGLVWTTTGFLAVFFATILAAYLSFASAFWTILFEAIAGYLTEHFASQFISLILYAATYAGLPFSAWQILPNCLALLLVYPAFYFLFARQIRKGEHPNFNNRRLTLLAGLGLFLCITLSVYPSTFQTDVLNTTDVGTQINVTFLIYAMFGCLTTLMLLFGMRTEGELQDRLQMAERLLHLQQEQYRMSKENIELINIKCHDLKHQIAALRSHPDDRSLQEIEQAVRIYDSTLQTGNNALDVILTEKSLYCSSNDIRFSCIADGEKLDFMDAGDIYALFGNIVSNAVEALEKLEDVNQREFTLSIRQVGDYLVVIAQNPFEGDLSFSKGLPETTKPDQNNHGFGMISIRSIVEKYGGRLMVSAKEQTFHLKAVFPVHA